MKRSKQSKQKVYTDLEVYPDTSDDEEDLRPLKTFHYHTTAFISRTGKKTATSAVAGPLSPKKATTRITTFSDGQGSSSGNVDMTEPFEFLQDGYFDSWDAEHEALPRPRVRTGAVSAIHIISYRRISPPYIG